ncbi:CHASE domain-containing protein [Alteromonas facilis]|uniref:CHASE domain-containing protein n=1 Tax=Alteromonas facilis TaxID=2048004 RepID=UPI000C293F21|nr:CHASE domain-containing protein [Alteromonas facilis]
MGLRQSSLESVQSSIVKALWVPVLVLLFGYFYAVEQDQTFRAEQQRRIVDALEARLDTVTIEVKERLTLYTHGLYSVKASVMAVGLDNLDYGYMRGFSESQDYHQQYPGARGFGFIRLVQPNELADFIQSAKNDRPDGEFDLRTLTPHQDSLFIIQYILPEFVNLQAIGLDIGSEEMRRASAIQAAETNSIQLTAPITLVQADQKRLQGFLILQPVYTSIEAPSESEGRMSALIGWSYAPLLIDEILSSVNALQDDVMLSIRDITNGEPFLFFGKQVENSAHDYEVSNSLSLFGREWQLSVTADQRFVNKLGLADNSQAFKSAVAISISLALIIFSIQVVLIRRSENKNYEVRLAKAKQTALEMSNEKLEREVAARTNEIKQANILQRSILEGAGYALIATDETGLIKAFNPAAERLLGYKASEMVGKQSPAIFHDEGEVVARAGLLSEELGQLIEPGFEVFVAKAKQGGTDSNRWTYIRKDGSQVQVLLKVTCLHDERGNVYGFLGIASDLSEQLKREEELSNAKELAEKANEAKSHFLANMSHEIRTPMNGIYGALQLLRPSVTSPQDQELLDKAIYSSRTLTTIINDILDFSKIEAGKLVIEQHAFRLSTMLDSLKSDLALMLGTKDVELSIQSDVDQDIWIGDAVRIRQILLNICSNAIKFTDVGRVDIKVKQKGDEGLKISVTDTGIGMSEEVLERLFTRFEQADSSTTRKYGGTGLGMAISHSLIDLMGGDIKVVSAPERGSKFVLTLPLTLDKDATIEEVAAANSESKNLEGCRILIAEDNDINRSIIEAMLVDTKANLYFAVNGLEAIDLALKENPDLILMDIQMPEMDGVEACKHIKQAQPELPIVALTANVMAKDVELYKKVGFDDHLAKPIDLPLLLKTIQRLLHADNAG